MKAAYLADASVASGSFQSRRFRLIQAKKLSTTHLRGEPQTRPKRTWPAAMDHTFSCRASFVGSSRRGPAVIGDCGPAWIRKQN